jgi:uncharacterized protein YktA (UPF0223 family)
MSLLGWQTEELKTVVTEFKTKMDWSDGDIIALMIVFIASRGDISKFNEFLLDAVDVEDAYNEFKKEMLSAKRVTVGEVLA